MVTDAVISNPRLLTVSPVLLLLHPQVSCVFASPSRKCFGMRSLAPSENEGYEKCSRNPFRFRSYKNTGGGVPKQSGSLLFADRSPHLAQFWCNASYLESTLAKVYQNKRL